VAAQQRRAVPRQTVGVQGSAVAVAKPQGSEAHYAVGQRFRFCVADELAGRAHVDPDGGQQHHRH
jgi:hypothetical protein